MVDHVHLFFFIYSSHQWTSQHHAADAGHVDMARYLVDKGVDLNIKDRWGVSEREYTADCKLVLLVIRPTKGHYSGTSLNGHSL